MRYFRREYVGRGIRMARIREAVIPIVDSVEDGTILPIWCEEQNVTVEEDPDTQEMLTKRGSVWCMCYSRQCPDGELGWVETADPDVHSVSEEQFSIAKERGWA